VDLEADVAHGALRQAVRDFLAEKWSPSRDPDAVRAFRMAGIDAGYLYRHIPRRYGGSEQPFDPIAAQVIAEEFARSGAPHEIRSPSTDMLVPTLLECGAEWQRQKFIQPTLLGDLIWCQGYSEPGAGSDLASLRTRAVLDGDEWIINGQKIWTTNGHIAQMMYLLARTEPTAPKHEGISYLLVRMDQPGMDVRPLRQITGTSEFNEVFLTDVRTPRDWIVGGRGEGWAVSRTLLKHERLTVGNPSRGEDLLLSLTKLACRVEVDGRLAIESELLQQQLAELEGWLETQRASGFWQTTKALKGEPTGTQGLTNKLANTDFGQRVAAVALDLIGEDALLAPTGAIPGERVGNERWLHQYMGSLALAIAAGTSNIQRNIIAERGLGLPRDNRTGGPVK
jgi:alkylation response protein AidB-like acyl-CoA dehydrogenase